MSAIQQLKKVNEILPAWIKIPFTPIIRKKLINNSIFQEQYKELVELDKTDFFTRINEQKKKLKALLIYAYEESPYYKQIIDERNIELETEDPYEILSKMPILTKELLKSNLSRISIQSIHNYYEVTTGGTTGEPTKVLMSNNAIYREWAFVYHYWSNYGYNYKSSKLATFRGINLGKKICEINPLYQEIRMNVFIMNADNIGQYVKKIKKYKAEFIYGYPSAICNFCRLSKVAGINIDRIFKAVFLISENLYPFQEQEIKETIKAPIAMFYGHSERAVFGEKKDNGYEFNTAYGVTEISEKGEPIVSGFINEKTPLIRYLVDDYVKEIGKNEFELVGHRNADVIYGKNGVELRASTIDFHGKMSSILPEFQFVQNIPGEIIVRIKKKEREKNHLLKERINEYIKNIVGDTFDIYAQAVDELEDSNGGSSRKYKLIINNIPRGVNGTFEIRGHRDNEQLYGLRGELISAASINFHDDTFKNVQAYQFKQTEKGICMLLVVSKKELSKSELARIERAVNTKFSNSLKCYIKQVDSILLTERGKYKMIIQEVGN